jgi:hypothetical protein
MADGTVIERRELMAAYRRPLRHVARVLWRGSAQMRWRLGLTGGFLVAVAAGAVTGIQPLLAVGALGAAVAGLASLPWIGAIFQHTLRLRREWRRKSDLAPVRRRRPHAGLADPDVAHDEFAVTAEDAGYLVTWRFRPLAVSQFPTAEEIEVPGRPRYAASPVEQRRFDALDAARAAEQLVEAQDRAARREADAIAAVHDRRVDAARRAELAVEARTTAAALQRATGQRPARD